MRLKQLFAQVALCASVVWALPNTAWAQAPQGPAVGTPNPDAAKPSNGRSGGGGFGLSIDLGSLFKVVQALTEDDRYSSPDTAALPLY